MRPTAVESLRGMQASLFEVIGPEVKSPFAQHRLQTMFMLLESVASELEGSAAASDRERIDRLLDNVAKAVEGESSNSELKKLAAELPAKDDAARWGLLEGAIIALEAGAGGGQNKELADCRQEIYAYLREVAGRGWSFWDMLSFRKSSS